MIGICFFSSPVTSFAGIFHTFNYTLICDAWDTYLLVTLFLPIFSCTSSAAVMESLIRLLVENLCTRYTIRIYMHVYMYVANFYIVFHHINFYHNGVKTFYIPEFICWKHIFHGPVESDISIIPELSTDFSPCSEWILPNQRKLTPVRPSLLIAGYYLLFLTLR